MEIVSIIFNGYNIEKIKEFISLHYKNNTLEVILNSFENEPMLTIKQKVNLQIGHSYITERALNFLPGDVLEIGNNNWINITIKGGKKRRHGREKPYSY